MHRRNIFLSLKNKPKTLKWNFPFKNLAGRFVRALASYAAMCEVYALSNRAAGVLIVTKGGIIVRAKRFGNS